MIELRPLRHLAAVRVSNVDKKSVEGQVPVRLCNYTDVYHGDRITPSLDLMAATATPEQVRAFRLLHGDVIITKDSEDPNDIGVPAFVQESSPDLVCGYHLAVLRPAADRIDGRYLYWAMASRTVKDHLSASATGITRYGLRTESISGAQIPWRPVPTQRAIACYLDTETSRIDALITKKRRLIELLLARPVLLSEERLAPVRAGFGSQPLKFLVTESDERLGARKPPRLLSVSIHLGVVPRDEMTDKVPRAEDLSAYKVCRANDVVINRMRAFQGGVGVAMEGGIVSPDYTVLRVGASLDPRYLHHLMRSPWFVGEMTSRLRGIGSAEQGNVRTPRVNFADLGLIRVPVPPTDSQTDLVRELDDSVAHSRRANYLSRAQIDLLVEHRNALITAAVTGELAVPGVAA